MEWASPSRWQAVANCCCSCGLSASPPPPDHPAHPSPGRAASAFLPKQHHPGAPAEPSRPAGHGCRCRRGLPEPGPEGPAAVLHEVWGSHSFSWRARGLALVPFCNPPPLSLCPQDHLRAVSSRAPPLPGHVGLPQSAQRHPRHHHLRPVPSGPRPCGTGVHGHRAQRAGHSAAPALR